MSQYLVVPLLLWCQHFSGF